MAYHGSPYEFEKFDSSKIGSGEGAQAYGHGLYFAENEKVAKGYQEKLAKKNQRQAVTNDSTFGNVPILESDSTNQALYQVHIKSDPAKFLDWINPLEQQKWIWDKLPEDLKNAIDDMFENRGHNPMSEVLGIIADVIFIKASSTMMFTRASRPSLKAQVGTKEIRLKDSYC